MYEARKVANFVLANYDASTQHFPISNLRINKLLFFMHGWVLVQEPRGLIRNHFEAWKFGPVIPSVYETFRIHGDGAIQEPAKYVDYATGHLVPIPFNEIDSRHQAVIRNVFESYADHSTARLVTLSHEAESPWTFARSSSTSDQRQGGRISNEMIRRYFILKSGSGLRH
jgi:uncharacterized phage-associated protein